MTYSEMLTIAEIVGERVKEDTAILVVNVNTKYTAQFADEFIARIKLANNTILNIDIFKDQRLATKEVHSNRDEFIELRGRLKRHLSKNLSDERYDELYKQFKFAEYDRVKNKKDQEMLKNALFGIKNAITAELTSEITESGLPVNVLDRLMQLPDIFSDSNKIQENKKESKGDISGDKKIELTEIESIGKAICVTVGGYFKGISDNKMQKRYSWNAIYKTLSNKGTNNNNNSEEE